MDDLARLLIERECGRLPLFFAKHADSGDHAAAGLRGPSSSPSSRL